MICPEISIPWNTHSDATFLTADYVFVFVLSALYISVLLSCFCVYQAIFSTPFFFLIFPGSSRTHLYVVYWEWLLSQYHAFLWFSFPDCPSSTSVTPQTLIHPTCVMLQQSNPIHPTDHSGSCQHIFCFCIQTNTILQRHFLIIRFLLSKLWEQKKHSSFIISHGIDFFLWIPVFI